MSRLELITQQSSVSSFIALRIYVPCNKDQIQARPDQPHKTFSTPLPLPDPKPNHTSNHTPPQHSPPHPHPHPPPPPPPPQQPKPHQPPHRNHAQPHRQRLPAPHRPRHATPRQHRARQHRQLHAVGLAVAQPQRRERVLRALAFSWFGGEGKGVWGGKGKGFDIRERGLIWYERGGGVYKSTDGHARNDGGDGARADEAG